MGETKGNRRLPIIIGASEAQAIALELEGIKTNRPMTHDLLFNMLQHYEVKLVEVVINDLHEGIFYARLVMEQEGIIHEIDSRPSDAVAIAVRFKAPMYVVEDVLEEAGIIIDEENQDEFTNAEGEFSLSDLERSAAAGEDEEEDSEEELIDVGDSTTPGKEVPTADAVNRLERLRQKLAEALNREDYELAAKLRDEINRLEGAR